MNIIRWKTLLVSLGFMGFFVLFVCFFKKEGGCLFVFLFEKSSSKAITANIGHKTPRQALVTERKKIIVRQILEK